MAERQLGLAGSLRRPMVLMAVLVTLSLVLAAGGRRPGAAAPVRAATFSYGEALQKSILFYEAQQSGRLPAWNRVSWRGDSTVNDGRSIGVDLSGGFYDAGDHIKFGFPMAAAMTMLAWGAVEYRDGYAQSGQLVHLMNNLRWGMDYFIKAHPSPNVLYAQVGNGSDHNYWGSAETVEAKGLSRIVDGIDASCPGTELAAETAASMAASSLVFRPSDPAYADTLLTHAKQLFTFADTTKGTTGQDTSYNKCVADSAFYNATGEGGQTGGATKMYWDELVWAAIWLHRATGEASYLDYARTLYPKMGSEPEPGTNTLVPAYSFGYGWNDKQYGVYALMAKLTGEQRYKDDVQRYLDYWTVGYKGKKGTTTPGGLAFIFYWASLRMAANTAFVAFVYSDYLAASGGDPTLVGRYHDFAKRQIDYALGDNPRGGSYMVGFGVKSPLNVHHRTAHGAWLDASHTSLPVNNRHVLIGALAGGPDANDAWADDRSDFVKNEVALDFNSGITSALARLYKEYGGAPLANFPPRETPDGDEIYVEARPSNANGSGVQMYVINKSAWPARVLDKATVRYFFTLDGSTTISQISPSLSYSNCARLSGPTLWSGTTYYVTVDCAGTLIFPGGQSEHRREIQLQLGPGAGATWDPANDHSYIDIAGAGTTPIKTNRIVVYQDGVRIWGFEPGGCVTGCSSPTPSSTTAPSATSTRTTPPATATATRTSTTVPPTPTRTGSGVPPTTAVPSATSTATLPPAGNLLRNGGFETDGNGDGDPDNWTTHANVTRSSAARRSGTYAIRHQSTSNNGYVISQVVQNIVPGATYSFSGHTMIPATSDAFTYRIELVWRNSTNGTISTSAVRAFSGTTNGAWIQASGTFTAPANTTNVVVRMNVSSLNATIYSDDFLLLRGGGATATPTNTSCACPPTQTATRTFTSVPPTPTRTGSGVPATPTSTRTAQPTATSTDVPPATPTPTTGVQPSGLRAQYRAADTAASSNQIKPHLNVVNGGAESVALSELKLRYYYSKEGTANEQYFCDYAVRGCGNVTGSFAQGYLEVGFGSGAGSLAPGAQTGEIQNRFSKTDWSSYTQTGDYSFDPTKTAFADWSRVTIYHNGTLVWGTPAP